MQSVTGESIDNSGSSTLDSVAIYSPAQQAAISIAFPISICNQPELHLEEAVTQYIPCGLYESQSAYQIRLSSAYSSFQPFYRSLKSLAIGTALRKPIKHLDNTPILWQDFLQNVTLQGCSITTLSKQLLDHAIDGGWAGLLIDFPSVGTTLNRAQEKALALRPYFVPIPLADVLGWQAESRPEKIGDKVTYGTRVTQLRIKDIVTEVDPQDEFTELSLPAVRVYDQPLPDGPVRHRLFVLRADGNNTPRYLLEDETTLGINVIPFVPCYGGPQDGFMRARPLLLDIAKLNLAHWQTSADLAHSLHLTSAPTLVISGVQNASDLDMAPDKSLCLSDPQAKATWIGAPTDGAQVCIERLRDLEIAMKTLAPIALNARTSTGVESAEAKKLDRAQSDSQLSLIVTSLEDCLNKALAIAALYWQTSPIELELSHDFIPNPLDPATLGQLSALHTGGVISHETLLRILENGELFEGIEEWSAEEELVLTAGEFAAVNPDSLPPDEVSSAPGDHPAQDGPPEDSAQLDGSSAQNEAKQ